MIKTIGLSNNTPIINFKWPLHLIVYELEMSTQYYSCV